VEAEAEPSRLCEERQRFRARHFTLVEAIHLFLIGQNPAREEGRQGELGIDDDVSAHVTSLAHQLDQAAHHFGPRFAAGYRTKLRRRNGEETRHQALPES